MAGLDRAGRQRTDRREHVVAQGLSPLPGMNGTTPPATIVVDVPTGRLGEGHQLSAFGRGGSALDLALLDWIDAVIDLLLIPAIALTGFGETVDVGGAEAHLAGAAVHRVPLDPAFGFVVADLKPEPETVAIVAGDLAAVDERGGQFVDRTS